jgi:hypothetical protein
VHLGFCIGVYGVERRAVEGLGCRVSTVFKFRLWVRFGFGCFRGSSCRVRRVGFVATGAGARRRIRSQSPPHMAGSLTYTASGLSLGSGIYLGSREYMLRVLRTGGR